MKIDLPLSHDNITREDLNAVIEFLSHENPILTQSHNVRAFEEEWSRWLGVKHSVFVNSGASANLLSIAALKSLIGGPGEIIVPTLTWVSDIATVVQCGFTPVFVDINPKNLCMDDAQVVKKLSSKTKAVFLTHAQGFNGLTRKLLAELEARRIPLIEDVCESHGATFENNKLGSFGMISNFSFYYAHHMSTIEGGMVCTNDEKIFQTVRMLRSHGMVREASDEALKNKYKDDYPDLNPDFIFAFPAYNVRNTEIGAVLGRSQLKRLDGNNKKRAENFRCFLDHLDPAKYRTDFDLDGSCNYAFNLILKNPDFPFRDKVMETLREANVEFRLGSAGGGNQLRQPYLRGLIPKDEHLNYPQVEHVHFFGFYIGNFPGLEKGKILRLCELLNAVA